MPLKKNLKIPTLERKPTNNSPATEKISEEDGTQEEHVDTNAKGNGSELPEGNTFPNIDYYHNYFYNFLKDFSFSSIYICDGIRCKQK